MAFSRFWPGSAVMLICTSATLYFAGVRRSVIRREQYNRETGGGRRAASPARVSRFRSADQHRLQLGLELGLFVAVALAGVVPQDHFLVRDLHHVLGEEGNLPAAARRVDHEVRHREARGPAPEPLHDL